MVKYQRINLGWLLVGLLSLFAIWPLLAPGLPHTADGPVHFYRAVDLDRCWRDGVYYPRWAPDLVFGYGCPLFNFAPPLLYYLIQAFHLLGLHLAVALKIVVILFLFLYALGMYLFAAEILGPEAGLLAAAAYLYTPYRLREAYIQGNYAQFLALATFPFILWAFYRLIDTESPRYVVACAFSYAALLLSHNISAMLFSPLLAAYVLLLLMVKRRWSVLRWVIPATLLALGLAAFFWGPAFFERRFIWFEKITGGHFDFRLNFLSVADIFAPPLVLDSAALNPYLPLGLGLAQVVLSALALVALARYGRPFGFSKPEGSQVVFFALVLGLGVFMMLPASTVLWENVPLLALTEFPWRILGLTALSSAFLAGASLRLWGELWGGKGRLLASIISLAFVLVSAFVYLYPRQPFVDMRGSTLADVTAYELRTQTICTTGAGEFLPIWVKEHPSTSPMAEDYLAGRPVVKLDQVPSFVQAEHLTYTATTDEYRFTSPQPFTARLNTLYFPGWRAYLDGQPLPIEVSSLLGLIEVAVPAGEHRLSLRFQDTPLRTGANVISLLSLVVVLALWLRLRAGRPAAIHRWSGPQALWLGGTLLLLLVVKEAFVDPHTSWFRKRSPPDGVLSVEHPARIELAAGVRFLGYDLDKDVARQGQPLHLRLYWKAAEPLAVDYRSFAHLDAPPHYTTLALSDHLNPGGIPISRWPPDLYTRDEHLIEIPPDAPPIEYTIRVGLYNEQSGQRLAVSGGEDAISLQTVHVLRAEPLDPESLPHREERFSLGGRIELLGYELNQDADLTLYWQAQEEFEESYTVFVHVLDEAGRLRAQRDSLPLDGMYPTSSWLAGQVVEDRHQLFMEMPIGSYRLAVGMYALDTMERLEVRDVAGTVQPEGQIVLDTPLEVAPP